jgi:hypothetical protein
MPTFLEETASSKGSDGVPPRRLIAANATRTTSSIHDSQAAPQKSAKHQLSLVFSLLFRKKFHKKNELF